MHEFDLIHKYFAPLARDFPGSLNLTDDAAILDIPSNQSLVVTTDAINEGVHFIGNETPNLIAKKLLRVNLSDLAAMGATPLCYTLTLALPSPACGGGLGRGWDENWIKNFAAGLAEDQALFHIHLAGGDTTATLGPASFSLTAFGTVPKGKALRRNGAKTGDDVYVSGTLGDAALGLAALRAQQKNTAIERYLLPQPRLLLGEKLRDIAHACMDISDGLVQDLAHICKASHVGAKIHRKLLPLSTPEAIDYALTGGDDYELLFTASPDKHSAIKKLSEELQLRITNIGTIEKGNDVIVLDKAGNPLSLGVKGYQHF